ncbi:MAG: UDP-N-acetylmuramate--L-alanine ligase [Anaerolinea thermophila]|uniref:UDP-N-acetylmuramate--L-alanine ligase n=1 Tax=Anaerolinea thermophila TaxID=167964 RepID=A0A101FYM9_9CHLR|nr:MAG: UDP-N-acetylmuramate--L-alanine ligase [Anaerolinea thermophila]
MRKHYHFIGIGGTGLSAIARVLLEQGNSVSGSDMLLSPLAAELQNAGATVYKGHRAEQVQGADIVIRSSAIKDDNVEVQAALTAGIPVLKRIDFLSELTKGHTLIAIAGTHGKTTTTAMTAWVFDQLHLDPTYIIGGTAKNLHRNAHAGQGAYFIIEADEYDSMFLGLTPDYLIITNVEHDHPDCYPTRESYITAFKKLIQRMDHNGTMLICADNPQALKIGKWAQDLVDVHFYGTSPQAQYSLSNIQHRENDGVRFHLQLSHGNVITQELSIPGDYNARNASAVLALIDHLNLSLNGASQALAAFSGTGRRFDILGTFQGITLIDDYGHHPTEIRSTIGAARAQYPKQRLITVWQPHTYSRTQELFNDYLDVFTDSDMVIVTEIYASREKVQDYSSQLIANQIHHKNVHFIASLADTTAFLGSELKDGDVVLILSAGDANQINQDLRKLLTQTINERGKHV